VGLRRKSLPGVALAFLGSGLMYKATVDAIDARKNKAAHLPYKGGVVIEKSVVVNKPPAELFAFWRRLENLPCFMEHLVSVTVNNDETSHWIAKGPAGMNVEWDARIINEVENELIAWRSLESANIDNTGSVYFEPIDYGKATRVRVTLRYDPPGKQFGAAIARLFSEEPAGQIEQDLRRLKQLMETGEVSGMSKRDKVRVDARDIEWPSGVNPVKDKVHEASEDSFPASDPPASW
jgi:uncharacterized membrane protein